MIAFRNFYLKFGTRATNNNEQFIRTREEPFRYIEFFDSEGTSFHLLTNRLDLTKAEILETCKNHWYIKLFFKWIKQYLKVSHSPAGIWNQLFITLITFALIEIMRLIHQPEKSVWGFLRVFRLYMFNPISQLLITCKRRLKKCKGRQRLPDSKPIEIRIGEGFAIVSPITKEHFSRKNSNV